MRTISYHCPHCKAKLWFLSLKPPMSEKVNCEKCGGPFLLTSKALADAWAHAFAGGGFVLAAAFFGIGAILRLEFGVLLMAPFLALAFALLAYVIAIPIGLAASH